MGRQFIRAPWFGGGQRAVLALFVGAVVGLLVMEAQIADRSRLTPSRVDTPRNVLMKRTAAEDGRGHDFALVAQGAVTTCDESSGIRRALLIDSGGAGRYVLYEHKCHKHRLGGQRACASCHHRNLPLDQATSCSYCHRDMYDVTDTFSHAVHERVLGGRESCAECHPDPSAPKDRAHARACDDCHRFAAPEETLVRITENLGPGLAPSYLDALHGLCRGCHAEAAETERHAHLNDCATCHRSGFGDKRDLIRRTRAVVDADLARRSAAGAVKGLAP